MATKSVTKFAVTGADGRPMHGHVHTAARAGEERPTVLICHGFKGFKDWGFFPSLADRLATAGFTAVRFNLSGAGVSDGDVFDEPERFAADTLSRALADVATVIDWIGSDRVGIVGHSRGGGLAVLQAARDERVQALVTWASIATGMRWDADAVRAWRARGALEVVNQRTGEIFQVSTAALDDLERNASLLDIEAAAARVTIPWLVIHGTEDETVSPAEGRLLAASGSGERRELLLVEGAGHTFGARHPWEGPNPHLEEVFGATVLWFARHLTR